MKTDVVKCVTAFLKSKNGVRLIVLLGVVGVVLILLSSVLPKQRNTTPTTAKQTAEEYTAALEERLTMMVSRIDGVGRCRVMVTLENGVKYVYASEEKTGRDHKLQGDTESQTDDSETSVILVQTDEGYEGLLVTELQPTVKGVVVVCEGGGDVAVQTRVTEALVAVLNVTERRVCVVAGNVE